MLERRLELRSVWTPDGRGWVIEKSDTDTYTRVHPAIEGEGPWDADDEFTAVRVPGADLDRAEAILASRYREIPADVEDWPEGVFPFTS